ncbi:MAG TPA: glycosyltransferase family 1 protein [Actinocrinis sp.]|jgi:phosphatidylinositol alpha 1,6-mannosyltransferase|uniref:glycosyltransferase family 4 protein n=1 Tax=Actinocrinis sp. TaxID=1920516 RepID=UPI002DDCD84F|nr:glycosyltransferase family 1 protein [Actinocrinis sp.]HEV3168967.1 glycosyltransferase family 1 protein [Actinocrinis sp.]
MRVALVTESFLPQVNGVTNTVLRILEHLAAEGHEALVVAPGPGPESYAGFPVVAVPGVGLPGYREFKLGLPTRRVEKVLRGFRPDVVHLASPIALGAAGARAARRIGVPCVAVFQTDIAGFARQYGFRGTDAMIWSWIRHLHRQAEVTLVPSRASYEQLRAQGIPRLAMWRRGVDADRFDPRHRDEQLRERLLGDREVIVGYVGRLAADKRVHLLAHLADIPGVRIVAVGDGPAAAGLRTQIPGAALPGFLSGQALSAAYASFDVFVHTGADDTFGQVVQEAMASGVPVVAPAVGGPMDLVESGRTGLLFEPEDPADLRRCVAELVNDPVMRKQYGEAARETVLNRSWSAVCGELMDHYAAAQSPYARAA